MKEKNKALFLNIIFVISFLIFIRLGFWQLDRADQKNDINAEFLLRQTSDQVISNTNLITKENIWRKFSLKGNFEAPNIFLDNQMFRREAGYLILSPFYTSDDKIILVNRGWHPLMNNRNELPIVSRQNIELISGILSPIPSHGIILADENIEKISNDSLRIQRIEIEELQNVLGGNKMIAPFMLTLDKPIDNNLIRSLILPVSDSEKNYGYAFQWFAFALTLLIIFIVLRKKNK